MMFKSICSVGRILRRRLFFDIWRKLIALLLACLAWFGIRSYLMQRQTFRVPVRVEYDMQRYHVSNENNEFTVWMSVRRLNREDSNQDWTEPLNYDLCVKLPEETDRESGECHFTLNDLVAEKMPDNVSILSMEPEVLTVKYDTLIEKQVKVRLPEDVPMGIRKVVFVDSIPASVRLSGPSEYIKDIGEVSLETRGLRERLSQTVPSRVELVVKRPYALVSVSPSKVDVTLRQEQVVRDVTESFDCQVRSLAVPETLQLAGKAPTVKVTVSGPHGLMESWNNRQVMAYADLAGVKGAGAATVVVSVGGVPSGLKYVVEPQTVTLELAAMPRDSGGDAEGKQPDEPPQVAE